MGRNTHLRLVLAVAASCAAAAPASAAILVLRTSSEALARRYPVGSVLEGREIRLATGEQLIIVDNGVLRQLVGPTRLPSRPAARKERSLLARLARAVTAVEGRRTALAATRGGPQPDGIPEDIWSADVASGGTYRIDESAQPRLWRSDSSGRLSGALRDLRTGRQHPVEWSPGTAGIPWPAELAPVHGRRYSFSSERSPVVEWMLRRVPTPSDHLSLLTSLAKNGCDRQFDWATLGVSFKLEP